MASTLRFGPVGLSPQVSRSSSHQVNSCSTSSSTSAVPLLRGSSSMSRRSVLAGRPLAEDCNWTTRGPDISPHQQPQAWHSLSLGQGIGARLDSAAAIRQLRNVRRPRAAAEMSEATPSSSTCPAPQNAFKGMSYSQQYDTLYSAGLLNTKQVLPKPDPSKQQLEPGAKKVFMSDVHGVTKRAPFKREWNVTDYKYAGFLGGMHLLALAAPFTFSWPMVFLFLGSYFVSGCLGITLSYHRQLAHKSFQTPKWLEYTLAYCGVLAVQGDPMEWASSHRYHHLHTDTPLDPHSPYEGFWWSHFGWLLDNTATIERVHNRANVAELEAQPFYRHLRDHFAWHVVAQFAVLFALGGLPAVVWGGALRMVWVYHITWAVNSATHVWGNVQYKTGDLSRNNWWMGILAWGEGWHNNHHAFEYSARHGLEWYQVDVTWGIIWALQKVGLATNVKLPTEKQKAKLAV